MSFKPPPPLELVGSASPCWAQSILDDVFQTKGLQKTEAVCSAWLCEPEVG